MTDISRNAKVFGTAGFLLGLSLAGLHGAGVAVADDTNSASGVSDQAVTATASATGRVARAQHSTAIKTPLAAASDNPTVTLGRAGKPSRPAATYSRTTSPSPGAPPVAARSAASARAFTDRQVQRPATTAVKTVVAAPDTPLTTAPIAAAAAALPHAAAALPTPKQVIATATVRVAQVFDRLGNWLSSLPANPVTDYLTGALQLVRRTLLPNVPTIPKLTVSNVSVLEPDSGTTDAVFTVTLDKAYDTPVTVAYNNGPPHYLRPILHDELKKFLWRDINWNPDIVADTIAFMMEFDPDYLALLDDDELQDILQAIHAAKQGQDYIPASGLLTFAPGQTSQQVSVPVLGDTTDEPTETFDLNVYATLPSGASAAAGTLAGRAATVAANVPTGVLLGQGIGTIISDDNPFGGIVTNADVSYLKLVVTTGVPGEVWRLETPDSFELLGNIHNGAFLGHLTLAAPTDLGRATPVVGSLNALLQTPCPDGQNGGCQASARTLIANVEGIADPAGFSLEVVGAVRSENEHNNIGNIETDYSYLLLPETTNNPYYIQITPNYHYYPH